jgi:hypothetical protein
VRFKVVRLNDEKDKSEINELKFEAMKPKALNLMPL